MVLLAYLKKCQFDAELERFFDMSVSIEDFEIEEMKEEYFKRVCPLSAVKEISGKDKDYQLDVITTDEYNQSKADAGIPIILNRLFRSYFGLLMSLDIQEFDAVDRFENELIENLGNNEAIKNYNPLCFDDWDLLPIDELIGLNRKLLSRYRKYIAESMLKSDLNIDIIDKGKILKRFQENYEPNQDIFYLLDITKDDNDFKSFINHLNEYCQYLIYCDEDCNPSKEDFKRGIIIDCVMW